MSLLRVQPRSMLLPLMALPLLVAGCYKDPAIEKKAKALREAIDTAKQRRSATLGKLRSLVALVPDPAAATATPCPGNKVDQPPDDKLMVHVEYEYLRRLVDTGPAGGALNPLGDTWMTAAPFLEIRTVPKDQRTADVVTSALNSIARHRYLGVYRRTVLEPAVVEGETIKKHAHYEGWLFLIDQPAGKLLAQIPMKADSSKELIIDANDVQGSFYRNLHETLEPASNAVLEKQCAPLATQLVIPTVWFKD